MELSYLLLFSLVVLCVPSSGRTTTTAAQQCSGTITAKYDDLPMRPPAAVPAAIGPYRGLKYNSVNLLTLGVLGSPPPTGLMPASTPNVAAFGLSELASTPNVTALGGSAGYKSFLMSGIAFGCIVGSGETVVNVPVSCTLRLAGYKGGTRQSSYVLTYKVANGETTKAMSVTKRGLGVVDTIRFELESPSPAAVTVVLDNFVYEACPY